MRTENVVDSLIWFVNVLLAFGIILFAFLFILFPKKESLQHRYQAELETEEAAPAPTDPRPILEDYHPCWKRLSEPPVPTAKGPAGDSLNKLYRITAIMDYGDNHRRVTLLKRSPKPDDEEQKTFEVGAELQGGFKIVEITKGGMIAERTGADGKPERQELIYYVGEEEPGAASDAGGDFDAKQDPKNPYHWTVNNKEREYVLEHQDDLLNQIKVRPYDPSGGGIQGVLLEDVPAASLAAKRGLQKGDVVKSVNGIALTSSDVINSLADNESVTRAGTVSVVIERQGRTVNLQFDFTGSK